MKIKQQKSTDPMWFDEAGAKIPYNRTTPFERNAEKTTARLAKEAQRLNTSLTAFKVEIQNQANALYGQFALENGGKIGQGKGNATFFNFDRSIKIEVAISEPISFDANTIEIAKQKLDEVINDGLTGAKEWVSEFVMDAFTVTGGRLDPKKVLGLRRHASRVNDARYNDAMALIDKSIRRSATKTYFRVWLKDDNGKYQDVQLNFSSI